MKKSKCADTQTAFMVTAGFLHLEAQQALEEDTIEGDIVCARLHWTHRCRPAFGLFP